MGTATTMTMRPSVSVCVANYNGAAVIEACLNSILAQQGDITVEILVHDDASTDDSAKLAQQHYPQAVFIESPVNVGFCIANNRMAAAAKGDYLLLLNNDATLFPDALTTLLSEAKNIGQSAILGLPQYDMETGELLDIGSLLDPFLNPVPNLDRLHNDVGMVMGACLWIPKSLWVELGGFPEWFGSIGEDLYLCCRARLAGYPVSALGNSGYWHRVGASFGGGKVLQGKLATTRHRRAFSERNKSFVMALTYPALLFRIVFPLHLALIALEGVVLALIKWEWALFHDIYLACLKSLWQQRKNLWRLRQEIQAQRKINLKAFLTVFQLMPHKLRMLFLYGLPHIK